MINLLLLFSILVVCFMMIGYMRGWQKEVITMFGLVGGIAMFQRFAYELLNVMGAISAPGATPEEILDDRRGQVFIQAAVFTVIAFFSYQIVGALAVRMSGGKLAERIRASMERRIIGVFFGGVNGYLVVGTFWAFLEYEPVPEGYVQTAPGTPYPFDPSVVIRPLADTAALAFTEWLPLGILNPNIWLIIFFLMFFFVIVALI
jgi:uncharacterized membrane protein required for colicin V production